MSATRRRRSDGTVTERAPNDYYRTPSYAVDAVLQYLNEPRRWLDPGCGDGAIAERVIARWPQAEGMGVEIDATRAAAARRMPFSVFEGDFLARDPIWAVPVDLVIGNPPFKQALEFARRALELVAPVGGEVVMLARAGFLEAERGSPRDMFLEEHRPDVFVLGKRPRFTRDGSGDACTYVWLAWGPGRGERFVRLRSPGRGA